ncbi:hypothetical protein GBA52_018202 [Prunus armeniaca]|nr:hypothetical protein GBA52_018202 [Prunus armeniaca]
MSRWRSASAFRSPMGWAPAEPAEVVAGAEPVDHGRRVVWPLVTAFESVGLWSDALSFFLSSADALCEHHAALIFDREAEGQA